MVALHRDACNFSDPAWEGDAPLSSNELRQLAALLPESRWVRPAGEKGHVGRGRGGWEEAP